METSSDVIESRWKGLVAHGYNTDVAEALAEHGYCVKGGKLMQYPYSYRTDDGPCIDAHLSAEEAFRLYLEWNGIQGYTSSIMNALDNIRNMEAI